MSDLRIQFLGGFHLFWQDERLSTVSAPRTQSVLAYLVLHSDVPHARRGLAFRLWPDSSEKQAQTNLRRQLHFLRNGLPDKELYLAIDHETVGWQQEAPFTLDVAIFRSHLAAAEQQAQMGNEAGAHLALQQAIDCYRGDLLPDCYDDWLLTVREELRQEYIAALDRLMGSSGAMRDYVKSIGYGQRLLQSDPLREETYRRLMELHLRSGDRAKALGVYHECASVLARELSVAPSLATTQLYERVLAYDSSSTPPTTMPAMANAEVVKSPQIGTDETTPEITHITHVSASQITLVGRQAEWQQLQESWRRAAQGHAHLVVIQGEVGVGKSRLAEEFVVWTDYRDIDTASTRSYAAVGDLAYAPIIDWLRRPRVQARLAQLAPAWLAEVARLMPELRHKWPDLPSLPPLEENWQRTRLFAALARAFTTEPRPLLLVLDDLQWCDAESLIWIEYFLQFCAQMPVLVVGTLRSGDQEDNPALVSLVHQLQSQGQVTTIELERLTRAAAFELAQQVRGNALREEELAQVYAYTQGNPLFLVETLRSGLDLESISQILDEPLPLAPDHPGLRAGLPARVVAVIQAHLTTLSSDAHALAQQLAVFGRACSVPLLAEAIGTNQDDLVYYLDELWQRRIVRERSSGDGDFVYDFSHDRIRDVAYVDTSSVMRRLFHRRAAVALEKVHGDATQAVSAQLARHYAKAGQLASAKCYYRMAGEWAAAHYAHKDGLRLLAQGLALCRNDPGEQFVFLRLRERIYHVQAARENQLQLLHEMTRVAEELDDDMLRGETAIRRAEYALGTGQYTVAAEAAEQALVVARRAQNGQLEAEALIQQGMACWNQGNYPAAGIFYERALKVARAQEATVMEAKILQHLGALQAYCGTVAYAQRISQQALEAAQRIQDREGEIWALNQLAFGIVEQGEGGYDQALSQYEQALRLSRESGYRAYEAKVLSNISTLHIRRGDFAAASACLEKSLSIANETGSSRHRAFALTWSGLCHSEQGNFSAAHQHFADALELFREIGYRQGEGKTLSERSWTWLLVGDCPSALADADEALQLAQTIHLPRDQAYAHTRRGYALECLGNYADAASAYHEACALFSQTEQRLRSMEPQAGLVRLALAKHDLEKAQQLAKLIVQTLRTRTLDATTEAFWVYETCQRVLVALHTPAADVLASDVQKMQVTRGASVNDPALRSGWQTAHTNGLRMPFLTSIPA